MMATMPTRRDLRLMAALGVFAVVVALTQTVAGLDVGLLLLAPALVLALPLLAGRYLGEDRLTHWRAAFTPRRRRGAPVLAARLPRVGRPASANTGALIAAALGRRGPPRPRLLPV
jgi:hypothetical protein